MQRKEKPLKKYKNKIKQKEKCWGMKVMIEEEMEATEQMH